MADDIANLQGLREKAEQAVRLAMGVTDQKASAALWAYAEELLEKATTLEVSADEVSPTEAQHPN
jgi:hypothetical protein